MMIPRTLHMTMGNAGAIDSRRLWMAAADLPMAATYPVVQKSPVADVGELGVERGTIEEVAR